MRSREHDHVKREPGGPSTDQRKLQNNFRTGAVEAAEREWYRPARRPNRPDHSPHCATGERVDGWTVTAPEAPTTIPSRLPTRGVVCAAWRPGHPGGGRPSAP